MVCIHDPPVHTLNGDGNANDTEDIEGCLVSRAGELIARGVLLGILIKLVKFMETLRDAYYFEFEISNHNIMIVESNQQQTDGGLDAPIPDFCLIN
jgi:hypothetical protein